MILVDIISKNKKISLILDAGNPPISKYTKDYQLVLYLKQLTEKPLSNCGYYNKDNSKLNELSKSTATHNTFVIDDNSSCKFRKIKNSSIIDKSLTI